MPLTPVKPMSKEEIKTLRDMQAFLDYAVETNRWDFETVLAHLHHDITKTYHEEPHFVPRTSGYWQMNNDRKLWCRQKQRQARQECLESNDGNTS